MFHITDEIAGGDTFDLLQDFAEAWDLVRESLTLYCEYEILCIHEIICNGIKTEQIISCAGKKIMD